MADIDFASAESRMNYLRENLGHLMNGIDKNYGQVLMDELMRRMETTVSEFNEEVKELLNQLQGIETTPRDNILASSARTTPNIARPSLTEPAATPPPPVESFDSFELPPDPMGSTEKVNEVEIEVDLQGDELSDFEKKLRSLNS